MGCNEVTVLIEDSQHGEEMGNSMIQNGAEKVRV